MFTDSIQSCETSVVRDLLSMATVKATPVHLPECKEVINGDSKCMGYLGVALQGAFHELLHANSFTEGLLNTIKRGGDTDTNGCIVGSMLGNLRTVFF